MLARTLNSTAGSTKVSVADVVANVSRAASLGFEMGRFLQDEACLYVRVTS